MDVVEFVLRRHGFKNLNPVQREAVERGLLGDRNMLVVAPTASGKTLIGEIAMIREVLRGKKAVYVSPLRALASEKYEYFKGFRNELRVGISTGDYHTPGRELADKHIIVTTYERFDSLIRNRADRLDEVGVVVIDEIHNVSAEKRGPVIEMIAARSDARIIGLSATIGNPEEMADRLDAELVVSDRRPVELKYAIVYKHALLRIEDGGFSGKETLPLDGKRGIVARSLSDGGQALIFEPRRRSAERLAADLARIVNYYLDRGDKAALREISNELSSSEYPKERDELASLVLNGVAYHHAGLSAHARRIIERAFRERIIKVIVATPTLAAGVNLPARTVVPFLRRYHKDGLKRIPVNEFLQMCGRAGRPDYDEFGEAIVVLSNKSHIGYVVDNYILGKPEPVESRVSESVTSYVLVSISEGLGTHDELEGLFSRTLGRKQGRLRPSDLSRALARLEKYRMIKRSSGRYAATKLGRYTVAFYLDPETTYLAYETLSRNKPSEEYAYLHLLYYLKDVNEVASRFVSRNEDAELRYEVFEIPDADPEEGAAFANILHGRINEVPMGDLLSGYRIYYGDFSAMREAAERVSYALGVILEKVGLEEHARSLKELSLRIKYGVREELLPLVKIRGIGRVIARRLYSLGARTPRDVRRMCRDKSLLRIEGIGEGRYNEICRSLEKLFGGRD